MDCEACTDRLIDLLYGELEDADADSVRAHLATCERCAGAFERLSAGYELAARLPLEEPPPVLEGVLAAARERAGRISSPQAATPARAPVRVSPREDVGTQTESGLAASPVRWLGSFVMGPQVAMAMMLFLMVGIGLWYLPKWRGADPMEAHDIVSTTVGDHAAPSANLQPAEPLALEEDPRRARIRPRTDEPTESTPARPSRARSSRPSSAPSRAAEQIAQATSMAKRAAPTARPSGLDLEAAAPAEGSAAEFAPAPGAVDTPPEGETSMAAADPAPLAMRTTRSSEVREGAPEATDPAELHRRARNEAASGACARAVRTYERLLTEHSTYPHAGGARLEQADCYRRLGRFPQARRALETASRDSRSASRARRELVRLEAAERAMAGQGSQTDRTPDPPARSGAEAYETAHE